MWTQTKQSESRSRKGKGNNKKLTSKQVTEIRRRYWNDSSLSQASLAREFGVTIPTISSILYRRTWRDQDLTLGP